MHAALSCRRVSSTQIVLRDDAAAPHEVFVIGSMPALADSTLVQLEAVLRDTKPAYVVLEPASRASGRLDAVQTLARQYGAQVVLLAGPGSGEVLAQLQQRGLVDAEAMRAAAAPAEGEDLPRLAGPDSPLTADLRSAMGDLDGSLGSRGQQPAASQAQQRQQGLRNAARLRSNAAASTSAVGQCDQPDLILRPRCGAEHPHAEARCSVCPCAQGCP